MSFESVMRRIGVKSVNTKDCEYVTRQLIFGKMFRKPFIVEIPRRSLREPLGGHADRFTYEETSGIVTKRCKSLKTAQSAREWYRVAPVKVRDRYMPKMLESKDETCLIMKDATHGLDSESTSVMDIKIGTRSYTEDVSTRHVDDRYVKKLRKQYGIVRETCSKREYMTFRDSRSTTASMGFRVTAMSVPIHRKRYTALTCGEIEGIRWYEANGFENTAIRTLQFFAYDGRSVRKDALLKIASEIRDLKDRLSKSSSFAEHEIIGSSLLVIFDRRKTGKVSIKWIDFAHVYKPSNEGKKSDGILFGLDTLAKAFENAATTKFSIF
mgnify:CR=1 FL=1